VSTRPLPRRGRGLVRLALATAGLIAWGAAQGSPMPSYTVVDLGKADAPELGIDESGRPVVYSADRASAFAFSPAPAASKLVDEPPHQLTAPVWDGNTHGNPANAYDVVLDGAANGNGLAAFIEAAGVYGHSSGGATLFVGRRGEGGEWEVFTSILHASASMSGMPSANGLEIVGINGRDQVLALGTYDGGAFNPRAAVYDAASGSITNIRDVIGPGYSRLSLGNVHLDDEGRILVAAFTAGQADVTLHQLLLVPSDLSAAPVPEPSTWLVLGLGACAFARRSRRS